MSTVACLTFALVDRQRAGTGMSRDSDARLDQPIPAGWTLLPPSESHPANLTRRGRIPPLQLVGSGYESPLRHAGWRSNHLR